jgi:hypothetical protein
MKLAYEHFIQSVADKLEATPNLGSFDISQVYTAVESLEDEGHSLEYVVGHVDLVAHRIGR